MPYDDVMDDLEYGGFTAEHKYCHDDTIDTYKYALNTIYGIDTDNVSETERLARIFGLDDINNMYPSSALMCARGNGKSFRQAKMFENMCRPKIKRAIFSDGVTTVLWTDETKTQVRCREEECDYEKGLAMAIAKRFLRTNTTGSNYYDEFKKWLPEDTETVTTEELVVLCNTLETLLDSAKNKEPEKKGE